MRTLLLFVLLAALGVSCKTTEPLVRVNKERKEITVFSSSQKGSSIGNLADSKKLEKTEAILGEKLKKNPKDVPTLLDLARIQLIKQEYGKARQNCNRALALDLHNKKANKILAEIELAENNLFKSEIILHRLGGVGSKDPEVINLLGLLSLKRNELDEAYDYFSQGLKIDEENVAIRMNLGVLYLKHRQMAKAQNEFAKILKITPEHADAMLHLAITYGYQGKNDTAESLYKQVINKDSKNAFAHFNLGLLQRRVGKLKESLASIEAALKTKDLDTVQMKRAEAFRTELLAEIRKQEEEEKKRQQEEERKKKQDQSGKSLAAKPLKEKEARSE